MMILRYYQLRSFCDLLLSSFDLESHGHFRIALIYAETVKIFIGVCLSRIWTKRSNHKVLLFLPVTANTLCVIYKIFHVKSSDKWH